jgi:hypothetical protein
MSNLAKKSSEKTLRTGTKPFKWLNNGLKSIRILMRCQTQWFQILSI